MPQDIIGTIAEIVCDVMGVPESARRPEPVTIGAVSPPSNRERVIAGVALAGMASAFALGYGAAWAQRARRARINYQRAGMPPLPPGQTSDEWVDEWAAKKGR